ncbi:hypothetical protein M404DRAFT_1000287 [Pisolithus tinctorius Marx 270]|uniref:Uncharacterized protein n=1 Tax=Pisolithus tinctorius Marx 270 TaxID=870435 RepID=A0A0C3K5A6_PISTI|nr:hypothetical protein M404DRAFT_1000287 [Pisolithus tinctorius Marx 270]
MAHLNIGHAVVVSRAGNIYTNGVTMLKRSSDGGVPCGSGGHRRAIFLDTSKIIA